MFIDESGDQGFRFESPNCSRWFVISAIVSVSSSISEITKIIKHIKASIGWTTSKPLHFKKIKGEDQRRTAVTEIVRSHKLYRVVTVMVPKALHEKSFTLGQLAQLVARLPGWITKSLREPHIDLAHSRRYTFEPTEALLQMFDANAHEAREALAAVTGAALHEPWSLKRGEQVIFTALRGEVVRNHHRSQLTVYLRLIDVPLPSVYGPTADERW